MEFFTGVMGKRRRDLRDRTLENLVIFNVMGGWTTPTEGENRKKKK